MNKVVSKQPLQNICNQRLKSGSSKTLLSPLKSNSKRNKKCCVDDLPSEVLLHILSYLNPADLLTAACVSHRWLLLCGDNVLWHRIFNMYVNKESKVQSDVPVPVCPPKEYWKTKCLSKCKKNLNTKILSLLKKISSLTGMPARTSDALQKAGIQWFIVIVDQNGKENLFSCQDIFYFNMAACIRWYSTELPALSSIKKVKIVAGHPVFWNEKGEGVEGSPCQKSLLYECDMKNASVIPNLNDGVLKILQIPGDLAIALWKDGGGIAFISATVHFDHLLQKCLLGTPDKPHIIKPNLPPPDDIDSRHGLRGYACCIELHNQRSSFWVEQFRNFDTYELSRGCLCFKLIDENKRFQHSAINSPILFPWKSEAFKGIVKNVCIIDVTLLDYRGIPVWTASSFVSINQPSSVADQSDAYDYDGHIQQILMERGPGKITATLVAEQREQCFFLTHLEISLALSYINSWFGTAY